jgi:hypothetical protein
LLKGLPSSGVFNRGIPFDADLQDVHVAHVLDTVCLSNVTTMEAWENNEHKEALIKCYRKGWLHADLLSQNDEKHVGYVFASPLHRWFVERKIRVTDHTTPSHESLFDFALEVLRLHDPRNLSNTRTIGSGGIQAPPEAKFQDEFYRCCHAVSHCAIVTFPEFGTEHGWVDFYIPSRKWGMGLLRGGNDLEGYCGRFTGNGKYTTYGIDDFIVLDFRQRNVRDPHPRMCLVHRSFILSH